MRIPLTLNITTSHSLKCQNILSWTYWGNYFKDWSYTNIPVCYCTGWLASQQSKMFLKSKELYNMWEKCCFFPFHFSSNVPFSNIFEKRLSRHLWQQQVSYLVFWRCRHSGTVLLITRRPSHVNMTRSLTNLGISGGDRKQTSPSAHLVFSIPVCSCSILSSDQTPA